MPCEGMLTRNLFPTRPPPSTSELLIITHRRTRSRIERVLASVLASSPQSDSDLKLLGDALSEVDKAGDIPGLDTKLITQSRELLRSRREEQRRSKERLEMHELADSLHSTLADLETELKSAVGTLLHSRSETGLSLAHSLACTLEHQVEAPITSAWKDRIELAIARADDFLEDSRETGSADRDRLKKRSNRVQSLLFLREHVSCYRLVSLPGPFSGVCVRMAPHLPTA